jgi:hypothetical protein
LTAMAFGGSPNVADLPCSHGGAAVAEDSP